MIDTVKFLLSASLPSACIRSLAISASFDFGVDGRTPLLVAMLTETIGVGEFAGEPNFAFTEPTLPLPLLVGVLTMVAFRSDSLPIWFGCDRFTVQTRWWFFRPYGVL